MSNYTPITNFATKDALNTGDSAKKALGTEVAAEFTAIQTMSATKEDTANKNQANGYAGLDASTKISASQLPAWPAGSVGSPSIAFTNDSNTGIYSPAGDQVSVVCGGTAIVAATDSGATVTLASGSNSAPSVSFSGDSNTGMYTTGAGKIGFTIDGTKRLEVGGTNGNVEVVGTFYASGAGTFVGAVTGGGSSQFGSTYINGALTCQTLATGVGNNGTITNTYNSNQTFYAGLDVNCGIQGGLATGATDGFVRIPTMAGTPTGAVNSGAMVIDTTGSKLWVRVGATWKSVTLA